MVALLVLTRTRLILSMSQKVGLMNQQATREAISNQGEDSTNAIHCTNPRPINEDLGFAIQ